MQRREAVTLPARARCLTRRCRRHPAGYVHAHRRAAPRRACAPPPPLAGQPGRRAWATGHRGDRGGQLRGRRAGRPVAHQPLRAARSRPARRRDAGAAGDADRREPGACATVARPSLAGATTDAELELTGNVVPASARVDARTVASWRVAEVAAGDGRFRIRLALRPGETLFFLTATAPGRTPAELGVLIRPPCAAATGHASSPTSGGRAAARARNTL